MVIAQVVRIRNNTLRTFEVSTSDPFYTPVIDGSPCANGTIEVTPGFDQECEGLVVPWEKLFSSSGFVITFKQSEPNAGVKESPSIDPLASWGTSPRGFSTQAEKHAANTLYCIVGPLESDVDNRDWLQFRDENGEPIAQERWMLLGRRHLLGLVGNSMELQLTFRDARTTLMSTATVADLTHFEMANKCAAQNTVFLNVFDLAPALSLPNSVLCNTLVSTMGAFHAAVEVYGEEWSFYRTPNPTSCGVCKSLRTRHHPVHVYRQSVNLGTTSLKDWEVRFLIRGKLASKWPGGSYDLLNHNCIHFCEELQLSLGVQPVPAWVRGLHETGASIFQLPWPLSYLSSSGQAQALKDSDLSDDDMDGTITEGGTTTKDHPQGRSGPSAGKQPSRSPIRNIHSSDSGAKPREGDREAATTGVLRQAARRRSPSGPGAAGSAQNSEATCTNGPRRPTPTRRITPTRRSMMVPSSGAAHVY